MTNDFENEADYSLEKVCFILLTIIPVAVYTCTNHLCYMAVNKVYNWSTSKGDPIDVILANSCFDRVRDRVNEIRKEISTKEILGYKGDHPYNIQNRKDLNNNLQSMLRDQATSGQFLEEFWRRDNIMEILSLQELGTKVSRPQDDTVRDSKKEI